MSEVAQVALITGGVGLLSLLITLWFNARTRKNDLEQGAVERREEHRERYRQTLFERRLIAVQEASWWLAQVKDAVQRDPDLSGDPGLHLLNTVEQARQWYGKNFLYLHGWMPDECPLAGYLLAVYWHARGYGEEPDPRLLQGASDLVRQKALELLQPLGAKQEA